MKCYDCPRMCGIDRSKTRGFCGEGDKIRVALSIENFMWEEPCITGKKGALAIFFSGCNLRCKFCQNYQISHIGKGKEYTIDQFVDFLSSFDLNKFDCIDLITPTQFSSQLAQVFRKFSSPIPVVWNSSGYEREKTIEKVSKFVDVFLVDFKYVSSKLSFLLSSAKDYFAVASKAIKLMAKLKSNKFDGQIMRQGVVIRHLILPDHVKDSIKVLDYIKNNIEDPFISIMAQFTPIPQSPIKTGIKPLEQKIVLAHAQKIGLDQGYFQDLQSNDANFIPKF